MIVSRYWMAILAVAAGLGLAAGQPLLALAGLFGLLVGGAEWLWTRHCLTGLDYSHSLSASHAAWGEEVTFTIRLANRKLLPLTWVRAEERVPAALPISHAQQVEGANGVRRAFIRNLLAMLPYEQVVRRYAVPCRRRGLFEFGPAKIESGDLLGYQTRGFVHTGVHKLIVYPKLLELEVPAPLSKRIVGQQAVNRVILTDPSRTIGVRSYQAGDPLRHVEWRASARQRELLVRVFEPSTELALAIFVNFRVPSFGWVNEEPPALEFAISLAASLARWGLERKYPVGLFGNGSCGEGGAVRLPVSGDPRQLQRIMEVLAMASTSYQAGVADVLLKEASQLPFEASVVLISGTFDARLLAAIDEVRRRRPLTVWYVKGSDSPDLHLPGINIVTVAYDDFWERLDQLQLAA
ncbi:MAG: DUF58 domain-containing protein [Chloroflexi bacterium]|nr:DUF58 domain-containing protein [Chloroflexota bacterium]